MRRIEKYLIVLLILISFIFLIYPLNQPLVESFTELAVWSGLSAKNFLKYGFFKLKFLPFIGPVTDIQNPGNPYLNHPPLFFWLTTIGVWLSKSGYWGLRIIPLFFSLGSLLILFKMMRLISRGLSWLVLVFSISMPMYFVYATFPVYVNVLLFFALTAYYYAIKFSKTDSRFHFFLILLFLFLASLTDYPGFFAGLGIAVFFFLEKLKKRYIISLLLPSLLGFGFWFCLIFLFKPGRFTNLQTGFLTWSLFASNLLPVFFAVLIKRLIVYFTPIITFLFFLNIRKFARKKIFHLCLSLLIFGILNIITFPMGTIFHPDIFYFLIPAFAIGASLSYLSIRSIKARVLILLGVMFTLVIVGFANILRFQRYQWHGKTVEAVNHLSRPDETIYTSEFKLIGLLTYRYDKIAIHIPQNKWREIKEGLYVSECFSNCSDPFASDSANLSYIFRISGGKAEKIAQISQNQNLIDKNPRLLSLLRFLTR